MDRCPQCGAELLIEDEESGEIVCSSCGLVIIHSVLDMGTGGKIYKLAKDDRDRIGAPLTFLIHDMGLSTTSEEVSDANSISRLLRKDIVRSSDKSLIKALSTIHILSSKMQLSKIVEENAALLIRRLWKKGVKFRRNYRGIAAASLYISSKMFSIPRNMKEFINLSCIDKKTFWRCYKKLIEDVETGGNDEFSIAISKIVNQLNLKGEVEHLANKILQVAREAGLLNGRKPDSMAAASIYLAAKKLGCRVNQRRLAKIASISVVTLRSRCKELSALAQKYLDSS